MYRLTSVGLLFLLGMLSFSAVALPELNTVGQGSYRYLFWQLYDARLATPNGEFSDYKTSSPLLLELEYKRKIAKDDIITATLEQWQKLNNVAKSQQDNWVVQLGKLWRDVDKGDKLSALMQQDGTVVFYFNGEETGKVTDTEFGPAFFDIWLSPDSSAPKLRRQLITAQ